MGIRRTVILESDKALVAGADEGVFTVAPVAEALDRRRQRQPRQHRRHFPPTHSAMKTAAKLKNCSKTIVITVVFKKAAVKLTKIQQILEKLQ